MFTNHKRFIFYCLDYYQMEQRMSSSLTLFLGAVRKRLNQRKISLEDFIAECKLRNKSKISIFQFAIIVQRINCGSAFFKARQLFSQVINKGQHISLEIFRALFLKVSKIPLQDIEINLRKNQVRSNSKQPLEKKKVVKTQGNELQDKIMKDRSYYSQIGFNRLVKFITNNKQKPDKIFDDCDLDKSGFIDRNQFNKFLVASQIPQFKDKDVRRYLISDVLDKLNTETLLKDQFFKIFTFKKPKQKGKVSVRQSVKLSQKPTLNRAQPPRAKIMSQSVAVRHQKKFSLPAINRGGKKKKHHIAQEESGQCFEINNHYENNPYKIFMGKPNKPGEPFHHGTKHQLYEDVEEEYYQGAYEPEYVQEGEYAQGYEENEEYGEGEEYAEGEDVEGPENHQQETYENGEEYQEVAEQAEPIEEVKPIKPIKKLEPSQPKQPVKPVQPSKPVNPNESNLKKTATSYYRLGEPKQKDLLYFKQFEQYLSNNVSFVDEQNPKANNEFSYKPAGQIFHSMGLIEQNGSYSLFSESDQSRNRNRQAKQFTRVIEADDIKQGGVGDCYFLSAIASIAFDYPEVLAQRFLFDVNPANYYVTKLFIDGEWKYIKTDDRYPSTAWSTGYCHPRQAEIWVMLLEKSFAKVFGQYQKLDAGFQSEAFFVLTGASSEFISLEDIQNKEKSKKAILDADKKGYLMTTSGGEKMNKLQPEQLQRLGLVPGHAYSLLTAFFVGLQLVVKLRNPWGNTVFKGDWSFNSKKWTPEIRKKYNYETEAENGTFFMGWQEYLKFFADTTICKIQPTFVHTCHRMTNNKKKSNYVQVTVPIKGTYHFFICQESARKYLNSKTKYSISDSRIILLKKNSNGKFQYVASRFLGGNQEIQINEIETQLEAGTYMISTKVNWGNGWNDHECSLMCYGSETVSFQPADRSIAPKFKSQMLASYALLRFSKAQKKDYKDYNAPAVKCQSYFDLDEGIGYFKLMNRSKKNYKLTFDFKLEYAMKVIKPNTANWKVNLKAGEDAVIGFFIAGSYGYEVTEYIE